MKALLREPLLHFLLLAAGLFVLYRGVHAPADRDAQTIVVDRDHLLTFLQYRSRSFDPAQSSKALDGLSTQEIGEVIAAYVREEALYREAKALQLDKNDYVSRLRMVQQLEFITRGFADVAVELEDGEIERYFAAHQADFSVGPEVSFVHVFFSNNVHGEKEAEALARDELRRLNAQKTSFNAALSRGDRFLYHANYINRGTEEIASHFGGTMQQQLFQLRPSDNEWRGPFRSPYGVHLVLLVRNEAGYTPALAQVRERVEYAARQAKLRSRFEDALQAVIRKYKVDVRLTPSQQQPEKAAAL